jgi:hypothetical protein
MSSFQVECHGLTSKIKAPYYRKKRAKARVGKSGAFVPESMLPAAPCRALKDIMPPLFSSSQERVFPQR